MVFLDSIPQLAYSRGNMWPPGKAVLWRLLIDNHAPPRWAWIQSQQWQLPPFLVWFLTSFPGFPLLQLQGTPEKPRGKALVLWMRAPSHWLSPNQGDKGTEDKMGRRKKGPNKTQTRTSLGMLILSGLDQGFACEESGRMGEWMDWDGLEGSIKGPFEVCDHKFKLRPLAPFMFFPATSNFMEMGSRQVLHVNFGASTFTDWGDK